MQQRNLVSTMLLKVEKKMFIVQKTVFPFFSPSQLILPYWVEWEYHGNGLFFH